MDGIDEFARRQVVKLCETWGYGAVMHYAAEAWAKKDPNGCLTVGPTPSAARSDAEKIAEYDRMVRALDEWRKGIHK